MKPFSTFTFAVLVGLSVMMCACHGHTAAESDVLHERVKHIVVLMLENRAFDHLFGRYKGVNGLSGFEYNLVNVSDPHAQRIYVSPNAPYVNLCDPDHSLPGTTYKIFGPTEAATGNLSVPTMSAFVQQEIVQDNFGAQVDYCNAMQGFTPDRVPVISTLASEYAIMDRFFASHPGPTWPNRAFFLAATSSGLTETGGWYHNQTGLLLPSKTIYDQVTEAGGSWKQYYNDTPWELFVKSVAHHPEHLFPMDQFWDDAQKGNLPDFAFINPRCGINTTTMLGANDDHPDHDVALGEQFLKDVYEAIRASPQWNETLFILTFDEHGGFYDHVPPPMKGVPPPDGIPSYPDPNFNFDRLGMRIPTILVSPWIDKGTVISSAPEQQKPFATSEYDLTSIMASARKMLKVLSKTPALTRRDAWAATFEHAVLNRSLMRSDCPLHLPAAPLPTRSPFAEAHLPVNGLQRDIIAAHAHALGENSPNHQLQGELSPWLQSAFERHRSKTVAWKASKIPNAQLEFDVKLRHATDACVANQWILNISSSGTATISTTFNNTYYCLTNNGFSESLVVPTVCYPSPWPNVNRDPEQQWVVDARYTTYKPLLNSSLCLTNAFFSDGVQSMFVEPCQALKVEQKFGYGGTAGGVAPRVEGAEQFLNYGPMIVALVLRQ